jgi:hypothetical protein
MSQPRLLTKREPLPLTEQLSFNVHNLSYNAGAVSIPDLTNRAAGADLRAAYAAVRYSLSQNRFENPTTIPCGKI